MSSDSDDDCYGNIAQRLQSMKNKYSEDKIETTNLLIADLKEKNDNSWRKNDSITSDKDCDLSQNSQQNSEASEEYSLDAIIAKNSKKRVTRARKRAADVCVDNILPEKVARNKRAKKKGGNTSQSAGTCDVNVNKTNAVADTSANSTPSNRVSETASALNNSFTETAPTRSRRRGRRTRTSSTPTRSDSNTNTSRAQGRTRRRRGQERRGSWAQNEYEPAMYDLMAAITASQVLANISNGTVYSVGNTDEYPDKSDDQPLFNNPAPKSDVIVIEENETELDENEELSVKVYWQSSEHVKFNIRRFQKLTKIFEHFAEREHVSQDKLFFTYNDKILKSDDTPDSISYSIVKFIDGGIINHSVSSIVKNYGKEKGIKLKFQCQNIKKPFVMCIQPDDTMSVVMMKCAEHLEKPLIKLKFYFDGDQISGMHIVFFMTLI